MSIQVRLRVAGEAYAVPVENVLEVVRPGEVTPVPGSPAELLGVLNLRGQIVAVADLAQILGLHAAAPPARMLVAESGDLRAGFVIDEVTEVGELGEPTEATESELLAGATLADGDLIGIIDLDRVLSSLARARP
jgi:purine-binding chemotaxis protein CheW